MTPLESAVYAFGQELLDLAIEIAKTPALPPITAESRRDPKIIGLALLCRSITNFRGALVLANAQHAHAVELRALVRLIFENLFFLAALCDRREDFVREMRSDEAFNRQALAELSLKRLSDADKSGEHALTLRTQIRQLLAEFPKPKKFHVSEVAASTLVDHAYLSYAMLSMDAHPSITSLRRHFQFELEDGVHYLTLDVAPRLAETERVHTVREACIALLGVCMYIDELLEGTAQRDALRAFFERFEASGKI